MEENMIAQKLNNRTIQPLKKGQVNDLESSHETAILENPIIRRSVRDALNQWLQQMEESQPDPTTKCRNCGKDAKYVKNRARVVHTDFGMIRYRRAYYVCPHCFQHTCPLDERLNPYLSLNRLRNRIAAGETLQVNELAEAWGLGSFMPSVEVVGSASSKTSPISTLWNGEADLLFRIQSA
jgi:hypothetical protein